MRRVSYRQRHKRPRHAPRKVRNSRKILCGNDAQCDPRRLQRRKRTHVAFEAGTARFCLLRMHRYMTVATLVFKTRSDPTNWRVACKHLGVREAGSIILSTLGLCTKEVVTCGQMLKLLHRIVARNNGIHVHPRHLSFLSLASVPKLGCSWMGSTHSSAAPAAQPLLLQSSPSK